MVARDIPVQGELSLHAKYTGCTVNRHGRRRWWLRLKCRCRCWWSNALMAATVAFIHYTGQAALCSEWCSTVHEIYRGIIATIRLLVDWNFYSKEPYGANDLLPNTGCNT